MFNNLIRQVIYPTAGLRLKFVYYVNLNFEVQFALSVRYVWKASFIIFDWLFLTLPPILTKYLLNSSAIILLSVMILPFGKYNSSRGRFLFLFLLEFHLFYCMFYASRWKYFYSITFFPHYTPPNDIIVSIKISF